MKCLLPLLTLTPLLLQAGEHTVKPEAFEASVSLEATFLPKTATTLSISPDTWSDFKILDVKRHGAPVKTGDAVLALDMESIDRKIADNITAAKLRKMALATAERELKDLEKSTEWKLSTAKRAFERTNRDLAYFKETGRPLAEEQSKRSLERAERSLEYQEEELKQLLKMYAEDDLTEETEEIILKRQKTAVESAKFALKQSKLSYEWSIAQTIPRQAEDLEQGFLDAQMSYNMAKITLPRALEQKSLEVKALQIADKRADQAEAEIASDRGLMNFSAPAAGHVYHGEIADGRWSVGQTAKFMKVGGALPARTVFASVVANGATLKLHGFAAESVVLQLKTGQKGHVSPNSSPRRRLPVTLESLSPTPGTDGTYHAVWSVDVAPKDLPLVTGMKGKVHLVTYTAEQALVVPAKALVEAPDGSLSVEIKLAEGAPEKRPVTVGREADGKVEILKGLESGQVVIIPEGEKK